ncbi:MAG: HAD family phosphatase [Lachnospiraceae bacterium]|nr:HAD family phosphatase [Lachnospiraceae bacterium]
MAITTVIFDIGQVLNGYGWEAYLRKVVPEQAAYEAVEKAIFLNPAWVEHDKGFLTMEEEIADFAAAAPGYEQEVRSAYENLGECTWLLDYANDWVKELKDKGYKVYALSDWPEHIYDQRGNKLDFLDLMDGYCLSFREHLIKPDVAAFENLLNKYGIVPEEAVFIDDRPLNIQVAKSLGMKGIVFKNLADAKAQLEKLGVK